jgi:hypothetical protein
MKTQIAKKTILNRRATLRLLNFGGVTQFRDTFEQKLYNVEIDRDNRDVDVSHSS